MNYSYFKSRNFITPLAVWAGMITYYASYFIFSPGRFSSVYAVLFQWDADLYLSIARDGYLKFPCPDNISNICGNIGWFPFYPMLGKILGWVGIDYRFGLIAISWISLLIGMLLLYKLVTRNFSEKTAFWSLIALAVFPGSFYLLTGFPYALYFLLSVLIFSLLDSNRSWLIIPLASCLSITYPSGALIGLPLLSHYWKRRSETSNFSSKTLIVSLIAIGTSILLYFGYYWLTFDDFLLYLHIQSQSYYAHELAFPLVTIYQSLTSLPVEHPEFISVVFTIVVIALFYSKRLPLSWQLYLFAILLFTPTMGTTTCYYRQIIVGFPLFVLIGISAEDKIRRYVAIGFGLLSLLLNHYIFLEAFQNGVLM